MQEESDVLQMRLRQRSAFTVNHLLAAARFSRQCEQIQRSNLGQPLGPFYDEQAAYISAAIMLSVASLESNINEYLSDPHVLFPKLPSEAREQLCILIGARTRILEKYESTVAARGIEAFASDRKPYQDVKVLIDLRNELVHFHPEWHDEQDRHAKLGQRLRGRFELSPFMPENEPVFPIRYKSHGCSKWAVKSALAFMDELAHQLGLQNRFDKHREQLKG